MKAFDLCKNAAQELPEVADARKEFEAMDRIS